ncbi:MAG TPA: hypothetical protein VFB78_08300 [Acidimicrobiales bacterium]|nr:hypothetical protein [Acidimicrobiales bacterium]
MAEEDASHRYQHARGLEDVVGRAFVEGSDGVHAAEGVGQPARPLLTIVDDGYDWLRDREGVADARLELGSRVHVGRCDEDDGGGSVAMQVVTDGNDAVETSLKDRAFDQHDYAVDEAGVCAANLDAERHSQSLLRIDPANAGVTSATVAVALVVGLIRACRDGEEGTWPMSST